MAKRILHRKRCGDAEEVIKKQPIILLDMDDTLCDLTTPCIELLNKKHRASITKEDRYLWHMEHSLIKKVPELTSSNVWDSLNTPGLFRNLSMMPGAKKSLKEMRDLGWRIVIVTSLPSVQHNPGQVVQEKYEWIDENLSGLIAPRDLIFTNEKYLIQGDVLIDDADHNLTLFQGPTIAFDQPWNRTTRSTSRVMNWTEVVDTCKKIFSLKSVSWRLYER